MSGKSIDIEGPSSAEIIVDTKDIFPPAAPTGLAAVAAPDEGAIDLSWAPNTETDLAGYAVYRSSAGGEAVRISPPGKPIDTPAFRDATAQPGHEYVYSVTAIDRDGNQSPRSAEVKERCRLNPKTDSSLEEFRPMRYCRFETEFGPRYGEVCERGGNDWIERLLPPPEEDPWTTTPGAEESAGFEPIPFGRATLLAPVMPSKIVCIGRNYRDHAAELGNEVPKEPLIFLKAPSSILAPGGTIHIPAQSERVDFEGELAIVIGKRASRIRAEEDVNHTSAAIPS